MANNEPLPNQVPDIALPDLKKKQKEKKKAGAAWSGGQGAEAFEGATGGVGRGAASAAARAAAMAAEGALETAGSEMGLIARLASTLLGKVVLAFAAAAMIGGIAAIAAMIMNRGGQASNAGPNLGGIADNMRVHRDGDASGLDMAKGSGRGDLKFDDGKNNNAKPADGDKPKDGEQPKDGAGPDNNGAPTDGTAGDLGERPNQDRLAHNLSGAKLSDGLGGNFGSGNVFGGNNKVGAGFSRSPLGFGKSAAADHGKSGALTRANMSGSHRLNLGRRGIKSNKALGQLRSMAPLGGAMTTAATADEAAQTATTQFEGANPAGAQAPQGPASVSGTNPVNPTGPNPGNVCNSEDPSTCGYTMPKCSKGDPTCDRTAGIEALVKQAQDQIQSAITLLIITGIICLAIEATALIWYATGCCAFVGAILWAIAILIAVCCIVACIIMGQMIKGMADQIRQAGAALGTDGKPSPQAEDMAQTISGMGDDITNGGWSSVFFGIGGFMAASSVSDSNQHLQDEANQIEQQGAGGGGTPPGSTPPSNPPPHTPAHPAPSHHPGHGR